MTKLAGLFVDEHVYETVLNCLELEPSEELEYQPYCRDYPASPPASPNALCQQATVCSITPGDMAASGPGSI